MEHRLSLEATFYKGHGHGNDYLVFREGEGWAVTSEAVSRVCDRWRGAGGDGIVAVLRPFEPPFRLRMFNPDGSEFERSGNGLRILGAYVWDEGWAETGVPFRVKVGGGFHQILQWGSGSPRGSVTSGPLPIGDSVAPVLLCPRSPGTGASLEWPPTARWGGSDMGSGPKSDEERNSEDLVERLKAGDEEAFDQLFERLAPRIEAMARRLLDGITQGGEAVECDFVPAVAARLPLAVIAAILGVPEEDEEKPRVIAFVCENDAYPALDMAGINRIEYNPWIRV